jgi:hypothetical protein
MVDILLDDTREYQNMKKDIFINKFGIALNEFIEVGDTFLNTTIHINTTNGYFDSVICNYSCLGYSFVGNNSRNYINLIFEIEDGQVLNIFEYYYFKSKSGLNNMRIVINDLF